jgi:hypothetical protein
LPVTSTETIFGAVLEAALGAAFEAALGAALETALGAALETALGTALEAAIGVRVNPVTARSDSSAKYRCNGPTRRPGLKVM